MRGFSLLELLVVLALIGIWFIVSSADLLGAQQRRNFDHFALDVLHLFQQCRWKAMNYRSYAGIVITNSGLYHEASVYLDGNGNGIRTADIFNGIDSLTQGPIRLYAGSNDIGLGILDASIPQIPPKNGTIADPGDPVKFGKSNIVSFSPYGDSSSGTLYLACNSQQQMYAIVLYGATARLTLWKYCNLKWQMVEDR